MPAEASQGKTGHPSADSDPISQFVRGLLSICIEVIGPSLHMQTNYLSLMRSIVGSSVDALLAKSVLYKGSSGSACRCMLDRPPFLPPCPALPCPHHKALSIWALAQITVPLINLVDK